MTQSIIIAVCDICEEPYPVCTTCNTKIEMDDGLHECNEQGHTCSSCLKKEKP